MSNGYQVEGANATAPFSLKLYRGDGMTLLSMNWRNGKPPRDFVGFAIEYKEPLGDRFYAVKNRIAFPGTAVDPDTPSISTRLAPIQKFRWVHFPRFAAKPGTFTYRVTPVFMNKLGELSYGEYQEAGLELVRETHPGVLNVAYTRGFVSSQAFVDRYQDKGAISSLLPSSAKKGLDFTPTHTEAADAYEWMGFEARSEIIALLDRAIQSGAEVRAMCYDLNLPEIVSRLKLLGPKLRVIIDDSGEHGASGSAENAAETALRATAGEANVKRMRLDRLQHQKAIAVSAPGFAKVLYGSTNFSWRGFYVQSNGAIIVEGQAAADRFFEAFDAYWPGTVDTFKASASASGWLPLHATGLDASIAYSPHGEGAGVLADVAADIESGGTTSVFFSLAFLGQTTAGPIGPAIGKATKNEGVFLLGVSDAEVKAGNLGLKVLSPDGKAKIVRSAALTGKVPRPFKSEPTGLAGNFGTRMHHKFVVLDFNTDRARVYTGSYNFSVPADNANGENLLRIRDRKVATSFMIEALRIYDHYRFRVLWEEKKLKGDKMELQLPPSTPKGKAWFEKYWNPGPDMNDRLLFS